MVRGTCAVCIRDISPAVKVNALQRREKENGRLETQAHTQNVTLESNAVKAQYAINGKSGDREGTEREKTASSSHGSVRVQKHMGMEEEEGSISRPLFFLVIFFFSLSHGSLDTVIGCRVAFLGATWRRRRLLRFPARGRGGRGGGTRCRHRRGGRRLFLGRGESRTGRRVRL